LLYELEPSQASFVLCSKPLLMTLLPASVNNAYMNEKYDESKESVFIEYLDASTFYGWAKCKCLPYGGFKWNNTNIDVLNILDNSPKGCILEVNLSYPKELHNYHSDLPLAPENQNLPKLLTTVYDKENMLFITLL